MASHKRMWALVEWVDEKKNMLPSYGALKIKKKIKPLAYNEADMCPGNLVYLRSCNRETPLRAKILQISENKKYIREQRASLEKEHHDGQNVLRLHSRTHVQTKQMKAGNLDIVNVKLTKTRSFRKYTPQHKHLQKNKTFICYADVGDAESDSSDSNSSVEGSVNLELTKTRSFRKYTPQHKHLELPGYQTRESYNGNNSRRRTTFRTSTPLPSSIAPAAPANIKLCLDKSTQTDEQPKPRYSVEDIEVVVKDLYRQFLHLTSGLPRPIDLNSSFSMSDSEENEEESHIEQNVDNSWIEPNNSSNGVQVNQTTSRIDEEDDEKLEDDSEEVIEDDAEEVMENYAEAVLEVAADEVKEMEVAADEVKEMEVAADEVKEKEQPRSNPPRVRKPSAQTPNITIEDENDVDMVPIGKGNAKVPARVLNDIDWKCYTTATRRLLQAVFSRRTLATHSLTGKQSPAFLNKPAKKILNPLIIDDIVKTVMVKCGVARKYVRSCITTKCTDETKLFRNRRKLYKPCRNPLQEIDANITVSPNTSDESMNT